MVLLSVAGPSSLLHPPPSVVVIGKPLWGKFDIPLGSAFPARLEGVPRGRFRRKALGALEAVFLGAGAGVGKGVWATRVGCVIHSSALIRNASREEPARKGFVNSCPTD